MASGKGSRRFSRKKKTGAKYAENIANKTKRIEIAEVCTKSKRWLVVFIFILAGAGCYIMHSIFIASISSEKLPYMERRDAMKPDPSKPDPSHSQHVTSTSFSHLHDVNLLSVPGSSGLEYPLPIRLLHLNYHMKLWLWGVGINFVMHSKVELKQQILEQTEVFSTNEVSPQALHTGYQLDEDHHYSSEPSFGNFYVDEDTLFLPEDYDKEGNRILISHPASDTQDSLTPTKSGDINIRPDAYPVFNNNHDDLFHMWLQVQGCNGKDSDSCPILRYEELLAGFEGVSPVESVLTSDTHTFAQCEVASLCTAEADTAEILKGLQDFEVVIEDEWVFPTEEVTPKTIPSGGSNSGGNPQTQTTGDQSAKPLQGGGGQAPSQQAAQGGGQVGGNGGGEDPGKNGRKSDRIGGCRSSVKVKKQEKKESEADASGVGAAAGASPATSQPVRVTESDVVRRARLVVDILQCYDCGQPIRGANWLHFVILPYEDILLCSNNCARNRNHPLAILHMRDIRRYREDLKQLLDRGAEDDEIAAVLKKIEHSLECPVCLEHPVSPLALCNQGHFICARCSFFVAKSICPSCRERLTGYICLPDSFLDVFGIWRASNDDLAWWNYEATRREIKNPVINKIWEIVEQRWSEKRPLPVRGPPSDDYLPSGSPIQDSNNLGGIYDVLAGRDSIPREPPTIPYDYYVALLMALSEVQLTVQEGPIDENILGAVGGEDPPVASVTNDRDGHENPLDHNILGAVGGEDPPVASVTNDNRDGHEIVQGSVQAMLDELQSVREEPTAADADLEVDGDTDTDDDEEASESEDEESEYETAMASQEKISNDL